MQFSFPLAPCVGALSYLYKKITEVSTDGVTFVATSDHYNITFNIVGDPGIDIYVDGTLSILDINILVEALLSEDTGKEPEKK